VQPHAAATETNATRMNAIFMAAQMALGLMYALLYAPALDYL
jgi:hypothetical protein